MNIDYTRGLAEKVCSLSLRVVVTFWHISFPKCRKVQIIARTETPPLLLVCRDDAATGSGSGGVALRLVYGPAGYDFAPYKYFNHLFIIVPQTPTHV